MKRIRITAMLMIMLALLMCAAQAAGYPESEHPYSNGSDVTWTYEYSEEAYALKITFSDDTAFEQNYDYLYITGEDGVQQKFTGTGLAGQSVYVRGDSFTLRLTSDGSVNRNGFTITNVEAVSEAAYKEYISTPRFTINSAGVITAYSGLVENLTIPSVIDGVQVTGIGSSVFRDNVALKSVNIPKGVTSIGNSAFRGCSSLTSVTIPEGVESIGDSAFQNCSSLTSVSVPDGVKSIGSYAFYECSSLTSVNIPDSVESIGSYAFSGCYKLVIYKEAGSKAAASLSAAGVAFVDPDYPDYKIQQIAGDDGKYSIAVSEYIGSSAAVTIPARIEGMTVTSIGDSAFYECSSLTSVSIPDGVKSIGSYAFSGCSSLTSVTIPDSVESIESSAFSGCSSLTSVSIPDGVESIGDWAFSGCSSLTSVTVPNSVTSIGSYAFYGCYNLVIYCEAGSKAAAFFSADGTAFVDPDYPDYKIRQIAGDDGKYSIAVSKYIGSSAAVTIPARIEGMTVTSIGDSAFYECSSLMSVSIPDSVTSVGSNAFYNCDKLVIYKEAGSKAAASLSAAGVAFVDPDYPDYKIQQIAGEDGKYSIAVSKYIGSSAAVTIPARIEGMTVTSIGDGAFSNCSSLMSVVIPEGVTNIGASAFYNCRELKEAMLPEGLTDLGESAFIFCASLEKVNLPSSLKTIGDQAFYSCISLKGHLALPAGLTSIGANAFSGCSLLIGELILPESLTEIGAQAFDMCSGLVGDVIIPKGVTTIGSFTFGSCEGLTSIVLHDGITSIGNYAFSGCNSLSELMIPASVTKLGSRITYASGISIVIIEGQNVEIQQDTFALSEDDNGIKPCPVVYVPEGSSVYEKLLEYGVVCGTLNSKLTLNTPLSVNSGSPTHIFALNNSVLDLSNRQNYRINRVIEYYDGDRYEYEITDNKWVNNGEGCFGNRSTLIFQYEDSQGNSVLSAPYYVMYGMADIAMPVIQSPVLKVSSDGFSMLPHQDLQVTWADSGNCTYSVSLYEYNGFPPYWCVWKQTDLSDTVCTIPKQEILPGTQGYFIVVKAISRDTGEYFESADAEVFQIYGDGMVTDAPEMTGPIYGKASFNSPEYAAVLPYTGNMEVSWKPVENAVSYQIELIEYERGTSYIATPFSQKLTDTSVTIPGDIFMNFMNRDDHDGFSIRLIAYDRYGNSEEGWYRFYLRTTDAPTVKIDGTQVSGTYGVWTPVSAGNHTIRWSAVEGAVSYRIALLEDYGVKVFGSPEKSTTDLSIDIELEDEVYYSLMVHAMDANGAVLTGNRYYISVNKNSYTPPELTASVGDFISCIKDIPVSWKDVGAVSYDVSLNKKIVGDANEERDPLVGYPLEYYSQTVYEQTGLIGNSYIIPSAELEYGAMYRILLTATYADGSTLTDDHLFKVVGVPQNQPTVMGAVCGTDAGAPVVNAVRSPICVMWPDSADTVRYEAALYTIDAKGERVDMQAVERGTEPVLTIPAEALSDGTAYELTLRAYDAYLFSEEYRLYFSLKGSKLMKTLTLPAAMKTIESEAFADNTAIGMVIVPSDQLTSIGRRAFAGCAGMQSINLPSSVSAIADDAFYGCTSLTVYCPADSYAYDWCVNHGVKVSVVDSAK